MPHSRRCPPLSPSRHVLSFDPDPFLHPHPARPYCDVGPSSKPDLARREEATHRRQTVSLENQRAWCLLPNSPPPREDLHIDIQQGYI
jgi:hypothetical protein